MFEYKSKDIPDLKKNIAIRVIFAVLFGIIFCWQFYDVVTLKIGSRTSYLQAIIGMFVLLSSFMFALISMVFALKDYNLIKTIKTDGRAFRTFTGVVKKNKLSYSKFYSIMCRILAYVMLVLFVSILTYSILQLVYYSVISYYLPLALFITVAGFNSVYHVANEKKQIEELILADNY